MFTLFYKAFLHFIDILRSGFFDIFQGVLKRLICICGSFCNFALMTTEEISNFFKNMQSISLFSKLSFKSMNCTCVALNIIKIFIEGFEFVGTLFKFLKHTHIRFSHFHNIHVMNGFDYIRLYCV